MESPLARNGASSNVGLDAGRTYYGRGFGGFNRGTAVRPTPSCCRLARSAYWRGRAITLGSFRLRPLLAVQVDLGAFSGRPGSSNPVESRRLPSIPYKRIWVPGSGDFSACVVCSFGGRQYKLEGRPPGVDRFRGLECSFPESGDCDSGLRVRPRR